MKLKLCLFVNKHYNINREEFEILCQVETALIQCLVFTGHVPFLYDEGVLLLRERRGQWYIGNLTSGQTHWTRDVVATLNQRH